MDGGYTVNIMKMMLIMQIRMMQRLEDALPWTTESSDRQR